MSLDVDTATDFISGYGRAWEEWDVDAFVDLFAEEVVYVAHPDQVVRGREELRSYTENERDEQGEVAVRMGTPILGEDQVVGEFWVTATKNGEEATIAGCLIAQLDGSEGRCTHFREYWFDLDGHHQPFDGWGGPS